MLIDTSAGDGGWSVLELRVDDGGIGLHHYIDDTRVECGATIELQHAQTVYDDDGKAQLVYGRASTRVRYESDLYSSRQTASVFADVGGYCFGTVVTDDMRFRWPRLAKRSK